MFFKENLRYFRRLNKISQDDLSKQFGYKSFTTVQKWEDGTAFPKVENLNKLAELFNVELDRFLNEDLRNDNTLVPIVGEVKAGYNMYADENIIGYEHLDKNDCYEPGEYFYLRVKGDSMKDVRICEGDIVYIHKQNYLDNRDIGVFLLENNEVTIKRALFKSGKIILKAENEQYPDRKYNETDVKILGKVIHNKVLF